MKVLVAPDSFKDSLSAKEVAEAIKEGIHSYNKSIIVHTLPLADGGEGTVQALVDATGGEIITTTVTGPTGCSTDSFFGILGDNKTAVIEMAAASGIEKLSIDERNPWNTTTYGTGELIKKALDRGCNKIILGIGGSATNDGGIGACAALGVKFFNANNGSIELTGGGLSNLSRIDISEIDLRLKDCIIEIACDVSNPLTGAEGASAVYGPQKGANTEMVERLDTNLKNYAQLIRQTLRVDIETLPGAGAAGGLGAGLMAFCNASLKNGFAIVAQTTKLEDHMKDVDLVITGEGKIDAQTQFGKTPMGVCDIAKRYNKPVVALAGTLGDGYENLYEKGFNAIFSVIDKPMPLQDALSNAKDLIKRNAGSFIRLFSI